ncbi:MAG: hypothetical protein OHM56_09380 [Spiroplasma phoeniceum]|nr:MAG: hypothetical protein OHM57_08785 [Spiroplasma phoeniceum]UZQ31799.1 MAG: hypothetical protein OHM56_09380 [Spiroplasma phoeniceum]
MNKEDNNNNVVKLKTQTVRRKIYRKANLIFFAIIAIIAITAGLGGVIYSIISASFYHDKNPWANAILLDDKITKKVNSQLSKALVDSNGVAKPDHLTSYVWFNPGEKDGIDIYANLTNIQIIQDIFSKNNWIEDNLSIVETMLKGTGASLSGTKVIYQNNLLNLVLLPKILSYPYNDGDDKYGLVTIVPADYQQGLFAYKVRFALQLIATDFAGYYIDLKKTFDYTYDTTEGAFTVALTLSQLLNLITNQKIINLVQKYHIRLDSDNEVILNSLLSEYYPIAKPDNSILINEEIANKYDVPFAPIVKTPSASDLILNIKYDSKKFSSLQQFGANLFNYHDKNYSAIANIFTKIGVIMPTFENVKNSYDLYDRNSEDTFLADGMIDQRVNFYRGFIKEMGVDSDNITDKFNYVTNDNSHYVWGSEHQIFYNEVKIKFLNINNNLWNNIYRSPTKIYYDQQRYTNTSINLQAFDLSANVKDVIEKVQYDDSAVEIDRRLTNQSGIIKTNLKDYLLKQLNNPYIKIHNIVKEITVGVTNNASKIEGTVFVKQSPINGTLRGNYNKLYQDKLLTLPKIDITVRFSYDGTNSNTYNLSYQYDVSSKVVKDWRGVDKNNLSVLQSHFNFFENYTTLDKITSLENDYREEIINVANIWENNNPMGAENKDNNYPVEFSNRNSFAIKLNQVNVGRNNNNNLRFGTYNASVTATKGSLNYQGTFTTNSIYVKAAPIEHLTAPLLFADSSWTQQKAYRQIKTSILSQAARYGLNLTDSDFMISGISENNVEKLPTGNKAITVTAVGKDNVVTGTAFVDLIVN